MAPATANATGLFVAAALALTCSGAEVVVVAGGDGGGARVVVELMGVKMVVDEVVGTGRVAVKVKADVARIVFVWVTATTTVEPEEMVVEYASTHVVVVYTSDVSYSVVRIVVYIGIVVGTWVTMRDVLV